MIFIVIGESTFNFLFCLSTSRPHDIISSVVTTNNQLGEGERYGKDHQFY